MNFKDSRYNVEQRSYLEKEGDVNYTTEGAFIEEEIFTVLRMNPQLLPTGNFTMIPSLNFNQLKHLKTKSVNVKAAIWTYKESEFQGEKLNEYRVVFPDLKRKLRIIFENKAPYKIVGWLDSFPSAFDKQIRTTKAILKKQKMLPYWSQNSLNDSKLRKELGL